MQSQSWVPGAFPSSGLATLPGFRPTELATSRRGRQIVGLRPASSSRAECSSDGEMGAVARDLEGTHGRSRSHGFVVIVPACSQISSRTLHAVSLCISSVHCAADESGVGAARQSSRVPASMPRQCRGPCCSCIAALFSASIVPRALHPPKRSSGIRGIRAARSRIVRSSFIDTRSPADPPRFETTHTRQSEHPSAFPRHPQQSSNRLLPMMSLCGCIESRRFLRVLFADPFLDFIFSFAIEIASTHQSQ